MYKSPEGGLLKEDQEAIVTGVVRVRRKMM